MLVGVCGFLGEGDCMGLMDMNSGGRLIGCLMTGDASISTRGLGREEYISYLISKIVNPYQSLYMILICYSNIYYWRLCMFV